MSSEDGAFIVHYDEWLPFDFIVPEEGAMVDLLWCGSNRKRTRFNAIWPHPGEWHFWRRRDPWKQPPQPGARWETFPEPRE